jgi:hypothetical protein
MAPFNPATPVKPRPTKKAKVDAATPKKKKYPFSSDDLAPSQYKVPQMLQELNISYGTWTDIQNEVNN